MDQDLQKWKDAVIKDKLTWLNVCEVKALESEVALLYSVTSLPESILIDPEGRIVGRNLRGMYLEKKLEELLSTVKGKK
jgi:hypothetical protein